jgi:hypothetical protein
MYDALQTSRDALSELTKPLMSFSSLFSFQKFSRYIVLGFSEGSHQEPLGVPVVALKGFPNGNKGGCEEGALRLFRGTRALVKSVNISDMAALSAVDTGWRRGGNVYGQFLDRPGQGCSTWGLCAKLPLAHPTSRVLAPMG